MIPIGRRARLSVLLLLGFLTIQFAVAQKPEPKSSRAIDVSDHQLASKLMGRPMPYRVALPKQYTSHGKARFPVIYLLHGLGGHFGNWSEKTNLYDHLLQHQVIIVMPEGNDGWYTDSSTTANDKYESYIPEELIPEIDNRFRTIAERRGRAIAGLSMGGYGAIKFGLKYPDTFAVVGSFSGALDAPLRGQDHKNYRASIMSVFGPDGTAIREENDVFAMIRRLPGERIGRLPYFYVSCGTEDAVNFTLNRDFAGLLIEKKIPHEYRELPGAHTWEFWNSQLQEFLRLVDTRLK